jgi:hypothetical protein
MTRSGTGAKVIRLAHNRKPGPFHSARAGDHRLVDVVASRTRRTLRRRDRERLGQAVTAALSALLGAAAWCLAAALGAH